MKTPTILLTLFLAVHILRAQSVSPLPQAPTPAYQPPPYRTHIWDDYYTASVTCSAGDSHSTTNQPTGSCGGALGFTYWWLEVGAFAPQTIQSRPTGYFTADFVFPLGRWCSPARNCGNPHRVLPLGTVGVTHLFGTTNALDFSVGADIALNSSQSLRFELKDYANFGHAPQHNAMLRITLVGWLPDP
jgi:hypothetical protein